MKTELTKPQPTTFEAHGHTWTKHEPGDPMPVAGETIIIPIYRGDDDPNPYDDPTVTDQPGPEAGEPTAAKDLNWEAHGRAIIEFDIIGWRYADATSAQEPDELATLRASFELERQARAAVEVENAGLRAAIKEAAQTLAFYASCHENGVLNLDHGLAEIALTKLSAFTESK